MSRKVLFVDDDANVLSAYKRQLRKTFAIETACGGAEGLEALRKNGPFAVVISDMQMPEMNGLEFLSKVKDRAPNCVRMMLTGNADQKTAVDAVNQGSIFRFYTKPCPPEVLGQGIESGVAQYRLVTAERDLLEQTLAGSIKVLVDVLSMVDPVAFGRTTRLRAWSAQIARAMALTNAWELDLAAMLSPIGQLTLPGEVIEKLRSGAALSEAEQDLVSQSPETSRNLIANIPRLKHVGEIVYYQAKDFDGGGFPKDSVSGADIPVGSRILRVLIDLSDASGANEPGPAVFARLSQNAKRYDPQILEIARTSICLERDQSAESVRGEPITIPMSQLRTGDLLSSKILTENGQLVLSEGHEITEVLLAKLRNLERVKRLQDNVVVTRMVAPPQAGAA